MFIYTFPSKISRMAIQRKSILLFDKMTKTGNRIWRRPQFHYETVCLQNFKHGGGANISDNLCLQRLTNHCISTHDIRKLGLQVTRYNIAQFGNALILGRHYVNLSSIRTWNNARKRQWPIWMHSYIPTSLRIAGPWVDARFYAVCLSHISLCLMLRCNSHNHQHELTLY